MYLKYCEQKEFIRASYQIVFKVNNPNWVSKKLKNLDIEEKKLSIHSKWVKIVKHDSIMLKLFIYFKINAKNNMLGVIIKL